MSGYFGVGDIVRRGGGWTPLRVVRVYGNIIVCQYCGAASIEEGRFSVLDLQKVQDPKKEFARCRDWAERLTPADKLALQRQRHGTAEPLPWQTNETDNQKTENDMPKLYQTKEATPRFGIMLATNSAGLLVMEMKGTGEVLTFAKSEVEEVKPYTVRIKFQDSQTEYEYLSRKGDVEKGDMVILNGNGHIAKVVAVDTKSDRATKDLVGRKVVTAPFGEADV
jgi:hypothetical protein